MLETRRPYLMKIRTIRKGKEGYHGVRLVADYRVLLGHLPGLYDVCRPEQGPQPAIVGFTCRLLPTDRADHRPVASQPGGRLTGWAPIPSAPLPYQPQVNRPAVGWLNSAGSRPGAGGERRRGEAVAGGRDPLATRQPPAKLWRNAATATSLTSVATTASNERGGGGR